MKQLKSTFKIVFEQQKKSRRHLFPTEQITAAKEK